MSRGRRLIAAVALSVIFPVAVLCVVELALSLFNVGDSVSAVRSCTIGGSAAYCDNLAFTRSVFPRGMTRTASPYAFLAAKPRGTYRIFVLGESAAYGDPDAAYAFSRYLDVMLRDRFPQSRFEVINASMTAINSHALRRMAVELAKYQPDLFIVYAGNNEVVGPYGPGTTLTSRMPSMRFIRMSMALRSTRTMQLIERATQRERQFRGMEMFLGQQVSAGSPDLARVDAYFEQNLRDIASAAHGVGADVVLNTVATNLRDCPPFHSLHKDGLAAEEQTRWERLFQQGKQFEAAADYRSAIEQYRAAEAIDAEYAELQFRIATCLLKLGDLPAARRAFVAAQEQDALRFRTDEHLNDAIRSVAREDAGFVHLVDAENVFASLAADRIPGKEFFFEHVHLRPHGNYLLAAAMFPTVEALVNRKFGATASSGALLAEETCDRMLALTDADRARLARAMERRLQRPPFSDQYDNAERLAEFENEAQAHTTALEASLAMYQWALQQRPDDPLIHQNLGLLIYPLDREAGVAQLRLSRPYHDIPLSMPDGTRIE
jgi:tetratricopeptide (TPR) repeat protein